MAEEAAGEKNDAVTGDSATTTTYIEATTASTGQVEQRLSTENDPGRNVHPGHGMKSVMDQLAS